MKQLLLVLIGSLLLGGTALSAAAAPLIVFTEEFPPFQYTENTQIVGASAEVVNAVLQRTGLAYEIKSYPWARSYQLAQEQANHLIFSISRRENREQLFKWIGIIVPSRYSVFCLRERADIRLSTLEDMNAYKIGTTRDDARETYLKSRGIFPRNLDRTSGENANRNNYKKLKAGRFELWPMPDAVAFHIVKSAGDDPNTMLRRVLPLSEISTGGYYLAASPQTEEIIVKTIRAELQRFVASEEYRAILVKWGIGE